MTAHTLQGLHGNIKEGHRYDHLPFFHYNFLQTLETGSKSPFQLHCHPLGASWTNHFSGVLFAKISSKSSEWEELSDTCDIIHGNLTFRHEGGVYQKDLTVLMTTWPATRFSPR